MTSFFLRKSGPGFPAFMWEMILQPVLAVINSALVLLPFLSKVWYTCYLHVPLTFKFLTTLEQLTFKKRTLEKLINQDVLHSANRIHRSVIVSEQRSVTHQWSGCRRYLDGSATHLGLHTPLSILSTGPRCIPEQNTSISNNQRLQEVEPLQD